MTQPQALPGEVARDVLARRSSDVDAPRAAANGSLLDLAACWDDEPCPLAKDRAARQPIPKAQSIAIWTEASMI
jgi:hypothetical protein